MIKKTLLAFGAVAAAVLAFACPGHAGILTLDSGPSFTPESAFADNTIVADTIVSGGLVHLVGSATVTPGDTNTAQIDISGTFSGDTGEKFSVAYEFAVNSNVATPVTYTILGTLNGASIQPLTGTITPGFHTYKGAAASLVLAVPLGGNFTGTLTLDFGSGAAPAPGSLDLNIQQMDFQLDPIAASVLPPSQPQNLSTRGFVGDGENVLIGGLIITGNDNKQVVLRALGPSLANGGFGSDALSDPVLELHDSTGAIVATNDNWKDNSAADQMVLTDNHLAPTDDAESALVETLAPGEYTTVVRGTNGSIGIGLVEIYDLDQGTTDSQLANISSRADVGANAQVAIGGFIIGGGGFSTVIVRGLGPSLSDSSIANTLADPNLELHDANGALIDSNDNWMDNPNMDQISADGLAPSDPAESALYEILPAGEYTAILSGLGSIPVGVGLVEIYNIDGPAAAK